MSPMTLPERALSIRQPWAWAIIHAGKDIENRSWHFTKTMGDVQRRVVVHASRGMQRNEYLEAQAFMAAIGVMCPPAAELQRGGIIGAIDITAVVKESASPWFMGPRGLVLANPEACEFQPITGQLDFFLWRDRITAEIPEPAPWMLKAVEPPKADPQLSLF